MQNKNNKNKNNKNKKKSKISNSKDIYIVASMPIFINPIAERMKQLGHNVFLTTQYNSFDAQKADVIICEWMDKNAAYVQRAPGNAKKVLRIHAYEVYSNIIKRAKIDFNQWDEIIFVNSHIRDVLVRRLGGMPIKSEIIPNGLYEDGYKLTKCPDSNKVAFLGYLSRKKGVGELELLANTFTNYEFHIAGKYQEGDVKEKLSANSNIHFHGWIEDKNKFFSDKKYIINTSLRESQCIGLMEGMLCGCKPIIRDWISADEVYDKKWIYNNINDIKELLEGEYNPEQYRKYIVDNYNFEEMSKKFIEVALRERE